MDPEGARKRERRKESRYMIGDGWPSHDCRSSPPDGRPLPGTLFFLTGDSLVRRQSLVFPYKYPLSLNVGIMLFLGEFLPLKLSLKHS